MVRWPASSIIAHLLLVYTGDNLWQLSIDLHKQWHYMYVCEKVIESEITWMRNWHLRVYKMVCNPVEILFIRRNTNCRGLINESALYISHIKRMEMSLIRSWLWKCTRNTEKNNSGPTGHINARVRVVLHMEAWLYSRWLHPIPLLTNWSTALPCKSLICTNIGRCAGQGDNFLRR